MPAYLAGAFAIYSGSLAQFDERVVPKQDIVLAFHSPSKQQFTEFAVG